RLHAARRAPARWGKLAGERGGHLHRFARHPAVGAAGLVQPAAPFDQRLLAVSERDRAGLGPQRAGSGPPAPQPRLESAVPQPLRVCGILCLVGAGRGGPGHDLAGRPGAALVVRAGGGGGRVPRGGVLWWLDPAAGAAGQPALWPASLQPGPRGVVGNLVRRRGAWLVRPCRGGPAGGGAALLWARPQSAVRPRLVLSPPASSGAAGRSAAGPCPWLRLSSGPFGHVPRPARCPRLRFHRPAAAHRAARPRPRSEE